MLLKFLKITFITNYHLVMTPGIMLNRESHLIKETSLLHFTFFFLYVSLYPHRSPLGRYSQPCFTDEGKNVLEVS